MGALLHERHSIPRLLSSQFLSTVAILRDWAHYYTRRFLSECFFEVMLTFTNGTIKREQQLIPSSIVAYVDKISMIPQKARSFILDTVNSTRPALIRVVQCIKLARGLLNASLALVLSPHFSAL